MTACEWMGGAAVMPAPKDGGAMTGGPRLVTWHYYVCPLTMRATDAAAYLNREGTSVHFVFNVLTGDIVQMIPASRAGRGLKNRAGGVETNRFGTRNFQVEVLANSPHWWRDLTPAGVAGLTKLIDYFRAHGVPDEWAGTPGADNDTPGSKSGHTGHRNWTENDHVDYVSRAPWELVTPAAPTAKTPAAVSTATTAANAPTAPATGPARDLGTADTGADVKRLQAELARVFPSYAGTLAPPDGVFGPRTAAAVREFQRRARLTPDGIVGAATRAALARHGVRL